MANNVCGICGRTISVFSDAGRNDLVDGCVCDKCYEEKVGFRLTQSSLHAKEIQKYKTLTVEQFSKLDEVRKLENEEKEAMLLKMKDMIISTGDIQQEYEIIGPVYFQCNNAGTGSVFNKLVSKHSVMLREQESKGLSSGDKRSFIEGLASFADFINILAEGKTDRDMLDLSGISHDYFDYAFYIACEELKQRAVILGGDAIIYMRQDLDLDTNGFQHFYLQMYGTAVKFKK